MPEMQCGTVVYFDIRRFSAIDRQLGADGIYGFLSDFHGRLQDALVPTGLSLYKIQSDTAVYWKASPVDSSLLDALVRIRDHLNSWLSARSFPASLAVAVVEGTIRTGTMEVFDLSGQVMGQLQRIVHLQEVSPDHAVVDGFVVSQSVVDRLLATDDHTARMWYKYGVYAL